MTCSGSENRCVFPRLEQRRPPRADLREARLHQQVDIGSFAEITVVRGLCSCQQTTKTAAFSGVNQSARSTAIRAPRRPVRDNFRDNPGDNRVSRNSKSRVYLAFPRGEVAERLKAAVC